MLQELQHLLRQLVYWQGHQELCLTALAAAAVEAAVLAGRQWAALKVQGLVPVLAVLNWLKEQQPQVQEA